jgi:hypothetical protein
VGASTGQTPQPQTPSPHRHTWTRHSTAATTTQVAGQGSCGPAVWVEAFNAAAVCVAPHLRCPASSPAAAHTHRHRKQPFASAPPPRRRSERQATTLQGRATHPHICKRLSQTESKIPTEVARFSTAPHVAATVKAAAAAGITRDMARAACRCCLSASLPVCLAVCCAAVRRL